LFPGLCIGRKHIQEGVPGLFQVTPLERPHAEEEVISIDYYFYAHISIYPLEESAFSPSLFPLRLNIFFIFIEKSDIILFILTPGDA
jgi:hypothetical protein